MLGFEKPYSDGLIVLFLLLAVPADGLHDKYDDVYAGEGDEDDADPGSGFGCAGDIMFKFH